MPRMHQTQQPLSPTVDQASSETETCFSPATMQPERLRRSRVMQLRPGDDAERSDEEEPGSLIAYRVVATVRCRR
jgi:hypothetical protein